MLSLPQPLVTAHASAPRTLIFEGLLIGDLGLYHGVDGSGFARLDDFFLIDSLRSFEPPGLSPGLEPGSFEEAVNLLDTHAGHFRHHKEHIQPSDGTPSRKEYEGAPLVGRGEQGRNAILESENEAPVPGSAQCSPEGANVVRPNLAREKVR